MKERETDKENRYLADYHTHSRISPDAKAPMLELLSAAEQAGLQELCVTDHVEPTVFGGTALREKDYDWEPMRREYEAAKAAWNGAVVFRLGAELGDAVRAPEMAERFLEQAPELDFIIGSIHALSGRFGYQGLFPFVPKDEAEARCAIEDYLEEVQKLAEWGKFDVLGHLTLPLRYFNELRGFQLTFDGFEPQVERILRTLIGNGCGIELNTNRGKIPLPDEKWLRMYRDLGGERITVGSDAHAPAGVGTAVAEGQALLKRCGFTRFCTFEKRQPVWHAL